MARKHKKIVDKVTSKLNLILPIGIKNIFEKLNYPRLAWKINDWMISKGTRRRRKWDLEEEEWIIKNFKSLNILIHYNYLMSEMSKVGKVE